ncbi:hypothetical protein B0H67DRAFT_558783 [Lasiosphaeris hirsuta]|uniref:Uncharacterized protein n=1 Tax=Lasiosphaeris hirsuta TaxID=260670 RepID=A0AA39ZPJ6_9PEZI|nr:hypothetical protein B0H67DRAFT_558783 [Lasiosphaeris hirsuta]
MSLGDKPKAANNKPLGSQQRGRSSSPATERLLLTVLVGYPWSRATAGEVSLGLPSVIGVKQAVVKATIKITDGPKDGNDPGRSSRSHRDYNAPRRESGDQPSPRESTEDTVRHKIALRLSDREEAALTEEGPLMEDVKASREARAKARNVKLAVDLAKLAKAKAKAEDLYDVTPITAVADTPVIAVTMALKDVSLSTTKAKNEEIED